MQPAKAPRISDHVLHLLAKLKGDANAGNVETLAVIVIGPDGRPRVEFAGEAEFAPSVNLGADIIKATLMMQILGSPGAVTMNSGLVVPGRE